MKKKSHEYNPDHWPTPKSNGGEPWPKPKEIPATTPPITPITKVKCPNCGKFVLVK